MINDLLKGLSRVTTTSREVTRDILLLQFTIVNACIVGAPPGMDKNGQAGHTLHGPNNRRLL